MTPERLIATVDGKGRITLPAAVCDYLRVKPGDKVYFTRLNNDVFLSSRARPIRRGVHLGGRRS